MKTQLLCTFCNTTDVDDVFYDISRLYNIVFNKIFILQSLTNKVDLFCTYNIDIGNISDNVLPNTISLHRKKETNTLYTINALNEVVKKENNNQLDTTYQINWKAYRNSILIINKTGDLEIVPTKIFKIVEI